MVQVGRRCERLRADGQLSEQALGHLAVAAELEHVLHVAFEYLTSVRVVRGQRVKRQRHAVSGRTIVPVVGHAVQSGDAEKVLFL